MASEKYAKAFQNPKGPGDARPTAQQIVDDEGLRGKLRNKVVLVTGCTSGIGPETARALYSTGARVFITARDMEKGRHIKEYIQTSQPGPEVELLELDLASLESVRKAAAAFLSKSQTLNILVTNAGIMACPHSHTKEGFELQFGSNHLGHFLLFQLLKTAMLRSATPERPSRVVSLSSTGHRLSPVLLDDLDLKKRGYDPWIAYGNAKTANILFANEIDKRYGAQGLHANSLHPGGIWTPLQKHVDDATMNAWKTPEIEMQVKSTAQGAATSVWAAVSQELHGRGGTFCNDCAVQGQTDCPYGDLFSRGWYPHAMDAGAASRLWEISNELVNLPPED